MHYNPFSYVHSEKDILKLVTTLMTNTKGDGSGGDPFWEKSERLLLTALMLIRSRLSDWTGGFIFDRRGTPENPLCRSLRRKNMISGVYGRSTSFE